MKFIAMVTAWALCGGLAFGAVTVTAVNYDLGGSEASLVTNSTGSLIGASWGVGTFAGGTDFNGSAGSVLSAFNQNGSSGVLVASGLLNGQISDAATSLNGSDPFSGNPIFVVIGDGNTIALSTRLIVFESSVLWPVELEALGGFAAVDLTDATLRRGLVTTPVDATGPWAVFNGTSSGVTFIPEPGTSVLALLGGFLLLRRRRQ